MRKAGYVLAVTAVALMAQAAGAAEWFVASDGKADNKGTKESPLALGYVASDTKSPIQPGDTIWLRGGDYRPPGGELKFALQGEEGKPILLRNYQDERATVRAYFDLGYNSFRPAKYLTIWGLEVQVRGAGSGKGFEVGNSTRPPQETPGIKIINCIVHDCPGGGFGDWGSASDHEVTGCLVYYNGTDGGDRGHGHGFYVQSKGPEGHGHLYRDNIVFRQFWCGTQLYGSDNAYRDYVTYQGNVFFDNGQLSKHGTVCNTHLAGGRVARNLRFIDNICYSSPGNYQDYNKVAKSPNGLVTGNYFLAPKIDAEAMQIDDNEEGNPGLVFVNNVVYGLFRFGPGVGGAEGKKPELKNNTIYGNIFIAGKPADVEALNAYGSGNKAGEKLAGTKVIVRPNPYEKGRANITVLNWDKKEKVEADISTAGLAKGAAFEVRDAQNFYGKPVLSGKYDGKSIVLPMAGLTAAAPIGLDESYKTPPHTGPEFGVFVVLPKIAAASSRGGETLYNGIVLPAEWPPKVTIEELRSRRPQPEPPYLKTPPAVIPIDVGRQLFVDNFLIDKTTLKQTHHLATYHPSNPVLAAGMVFSGGVFYDPADKTFKMWMHYGGTGYSTSKDGIAWEKPKNVLGGKSDSQCVWLDLENKDPAKRFVMTRSVVADNACMGRIFYSADGINWGSEVGRTGSWGDRSTFFYNPFRKMWVISARHGWSNPRERRYWEVKGDLAAGPYWGQPGQPGSAPFWTGADELDPQRPDYKINPELYNLDCAGYESLMLGLFTIWRGQPGPREKPNEVCIGYSRDGFNWSRPDRRAFCPVSETPGTWNYANVQSAAGGCLIVKDQLYFYVSGRGKGNVTSLATIRRDGFTSMDAGEGGGDLTTRPVIFSGKYMFVNLRAPGGELTAEVLDEGGRPIAPFTRENCMPVKGDRTLLPVRWKGAEDLGAVSGKPVRFRFYLSNGSLYAFWVSPETSGASHGSVAGGGPGFTSGWDTVGEPGAYVR